MAAPHSSEYLKAIECLGGHAGYWKSCSLRCDHRTSTKETEKRQDHFPHIGERTVLSIHSTESRTALHVYILKHRSGRHTETIPHKHMYQQYSIGKILFTAADGFGGIQGDVFGDNEELSVSDTITRYVLVVSTPVILNFLLFNFTAAVVFGSFGDVQQAMKEVIKEENKDLQTMSVCCLLLSLCTFLTCQIHARIHLFEVVHRHSKLQYFIATASNVILLLLQVVNRLPKTARVSRSNIVSNSIHIFPTHVSPWVRWKLGVFVGLNAWESHLPKMKEYSGPVNVEYRQDYGHKSSGLHDTASPELCGT